MACALDGQRHVTLVSGTKATAAPRSDLAALGDIVAQHIHSLVIHFQRLVSAKGTLAACWRWTVPSAPFPLSFLRRPIAPWPIRRRPIAPWSRRFLRSFRFCNQLEPPWIAGPDNSTPDPSLSPGCRAETLLICTGLFLWSSHRGFVSVHDQVTDDIFHQLDGSL